MNVKKQPTYQELNSQLDELLARLQQPDIQVDEAVRLYEEGLTLVATLEKQLKQAENTITKLKLQASGEAS
ncbi:MAG TPA: exodeoxyribonuclease VII small subunit [Patescibacteria group bacterium]|nr:exodeoxyribonuclease VII small subunit [Patescibacteria group bacterium]